MNSIFRIVLTGLAGCTAAGPVCIPAQAAEDRPYEVAFGSLAPLNTDIFIADADGSNARPLFTHPNQDYNASLSRDGKWIVFTSQRDGSADIYRARIEGVGTDGVALEKLVEHPSFDDQATLSPDGRQLAFVSSRSGQADVWILNLRSKVLRNLTHHAGGDFRPDWSPDGKWLAFSSERDSLHPKFPNDFVEWQSTEIYVIRPDGTGLRRITSKQEFVGSPTWSSDGRRLVYYTTPVMNGRSVISALRRGGTTQIESIDMSSGQIRVETSGPGEKWSPHWATSNRIGFVSGGAGGGVESVQGPAGARGVFRNPNWAHDGSRMVFQRDVKSMEKDWPPNENWYSRDSRFRLIRAGLFPAYSPNGQHLASIDRTAGKLQNSILGMNPDGAQRTVLYSSTEKSALAPDWSPNSEWIAFSTGQFFQTMPNGQAAADIAIMRSDGSKLKIITDGKANAGFPSWSSDGKLLVYRETANGMNSLKVIEPSTGESRVLISGHAHYNFPAWSPTRDLIAFTADIDGDYEIYTVKSDGTHLKRLTKSPGNDAHNSWSRDGEWIAFTTARKGYKDESFLHVGNPQSSGEIAVMRFDGSDVRMLTDNQFEEGSPAWRPRL